MIVDDDRIVVFSQDAENDEFRLGLLCHIHLFIEQPFSLQLLLWLYTLYQTVCERRKRTNKKISLNQTVGYCIPAGIEIRNELRE